MCNQHTKMGFQINLNDLPDEMLLEIFQNLHILDRVRFRSVCQKWRILILKHTTELLFDSSIIPSTSLEISWNNRICLGYEDHEKIFQAFCFLIEQTGNTLRQISLTGNWYTRFLSDNYDGIDWTILTEIIQMMNEKCPKLICLDIERDDSISEDLLISMMQTLGPKLEKVFFDHPHPLSIMFDSLHAEKVCAFSFEGKDSDDLDKVCLHFPRLTELKATIPKVANSLEPLRSLKNLSKLKLYIRPPHSDTSRLFPKGHLGLNLISLDLSVDKFSLEHLISLTNPGSLRYFSVWINKCIDLDALFRSLLRVERLQLCIDKLHSFETFKQIVAMKKLKHLMIKTGFLKKEFLSTLLPITSVTNLEFSFNHDTFCKRMLILLLIPVFPNLQTLRIRVCVLCYSGLIDLVESLPNLRIIHLELADFCKTKILERLKPVCDYNNVSLMFY